MITRRVTGWFCFLPAVGLALAFVSPAFGQGEEAGNEPSAAGRVGGVFQRFFAPRENNDTEKGSTTPKGSSRGFKPGAFQGGFVKQLKAIADPSPESDVSVEETAPSQPQRQTAVPMTPSQMAQRSPSREPFSSPPPSGTPPTVRRPSTSLPPRDVFAEDPPSLVGTGVDTRRSSTQLPATGTLRSNEPPVITREIPKSKSSASNDEPLVKTPASTRNKAAVAEEELEIPRVSRKSVPAAAASTSVTTPSTPSSSTASTSKTPPSTSVGAPPSTSYAIPSNPYTAPPNLSSTPEANRYAPSTSGAGSSVKTPSSGTATSAAPTAKTSTPPLSGTTNAGVASNVATTPRGETRAEMSIPKVKLFVSGPLRCKSDDPFRTKCWFAMKEMKC